MERSLTIWLGAVGLSVGSFLNVVIARVPKGESVVRPRSRCPTCGHQLPWYENVPVLSWLWLRGRCSGCKRPISPRYVLVELLTAVLFVAALSQTGWDWRLVRLLTFLTLLVPLIFIDAETFVLPMSLTLPGIAAGVLLAVPQGWPAVASSLTGAALGFVVYRSLEFGAWLGTSWKNPKTGRREGLEGLGAGDKYLVAMICATLGPKALLGIVTLSSVQAAIYGLLALRLTGRAGPTLGAPVERDAEHDDRRPWTPVVFDRTRPLWWRLLVGLPDSLFTQDLPDPLPIDPATGEEEAWVPQASSTPLGPWLGLAALECLFAGHWLAGLFDDTPFAQFAAAIFGAW